MSYRPETDFKETCADKRTDDGRLQKTIHFQGQLCRTNVESLKVIRQGAQKLSSGNLSGGSERKKNEKKNDAETINAGNALIM